MSALCLSSSPQAPPRAPLERRQRQQHLDLSRSVLQSSLTLAAPSSPTSAYCDGEISPSFDASFASSMSISVDHQLDAPIDVSRAAAGAAGAMLASSPVYMDISSPAQPTPTSSTPHRATRRSPPARNNDSSSFPFLRQLFQETSVPRLGARRPSGGAVGSERPRRPSFATAGPSPLSGEHALDEDAEEAQQVLGGSPCRRSSDPSMDRLKVGLPKRKNLTSPTLKPPTSLLLASHRKSDPALRTESSPFRMDIDMSSPVPRPASADPLRSSQGSVLADDSTCDEPEEYDLSQSSSASDKLGALFADSMSPAPLASRKRLLVDESPSAASEPSSVHDSPTPANTALPRRPAFEKATTISGFPAGGGFGAARRRTGSRDLPTIAPLKMRRPSLTSAFSVPNTAAIDGSDKENHLCGRPPAVRMSSNKRSAHESAGGSGRPVPKAMRRAYSVADAVLPPAIAPPPRQRPVTEDEPMGSGSFLRATNVGASLDLGDSRSRSRRMDERESPARRAPSASLFRQAGSPLAGMLNDEKAGKALPCFGVKDDGLMRITPTTLNGLMTGEYSDTVARYYIVDCRFSYEFEGGHIRNAVNLSTTADVVQAFFDRSELPAPSTSAHAQKQGKTVLIFHCEFSAQRAPTSAKELRSKDRTLNSDVYPRVHYPELYLLQGGYADFFKAFPNLCEGPCGYVPMDDPQHQQKRSADILTFRQEKRHFSRARSFTFGESMSSSSRPDGALSRGGGGGGGGDNKAGPPRRPPLAPVPSFQFPTLPKKTISAPAASAVASAPTITEEDHDAGDSSFGPDGSSPGGELGGSPCPGGLLRPHGRKASQDVLGLASGSASMLPPAQPSLLAAPVQRKTFERAQTMSAMFRR